MLNITQPLPCNKQGKPPAIAEYLSGSGAPVPGRQASAQVWTTLVHTAFDGSSWSSSLMPAPMTPRSLTRLSPAR